MENCSYKFYKMWEGWLLSLEESRNRTGPGEGGYCDIFHSGTLKEPQEFTVRPSTVPSLALIM